MKRGLIALLAVAATVLVPTATAGTVRSLAGESFTAGSSQILSCGISDWGGSVRYSTTGTATGPYPGTFTETGTITVGQADAYGRQLVTAATVDFTVTTARYTVTGSHTYSLAGYQGSNPPTASCGFSYTYYALQAAAYMSTNTLRWNATIAADGGPTCTASGPALLSFRQNSSYLSDSFSETFYNDVPATEPSCVGSDTTPPVFTSLPGDLTAEATSADGAVVEYAVAASDDSGDLPAVSCAPGSGATFPLGETTVTCLATDAAGNVSAPATFTVTVEDTTAPTFTAVPADLTVDATSAAGAVVEFTAAAADAVDPAPVVTCDPASGSTFAAGATTVTCVATDAAGNASAPAGFVVTVRGAVEQVADGLASGFPGLDAKQRAILADLQAGRIAAACGVLDAYANQVAALAGKKLTAEQAAGLLATVDRVKTLLRC